MPCQGLAYSRMGAQQREVPLNEVWHSYVSTAGHMDVAIAADLDDADTHMRSLFVDA